MPIYRAEHTCGYKNEIFLNADKHEILIRCKRCKMQVAARQVRDKRAMYKTKNEVTGVFTNETNQT